MKKHTVEIQFSNRNLRDEFMQWFQDDGEELFYDWVMNMVDDTDDIQFEYDLDNNIIEIE